MYPLNVVDDRLLMSTNHGRKNEKIRFCTQIDIISAQSHYAPFRMTVYNYSETCDKRPSVG